MNDPTILWLQGGPGCSSLFGAFVEHGPFIIQNDGSFVNNSFAWNTAANVLYIDSPPGTGFSTTNSTNGYDTNERAVAADLYKALQAFFRYNNGQYRSSSRFYIAGESVRKKKKEKKKNCLLYFLTTTSVCRQVCPIFGSLYLESNCCTKRL